jgi:hypothetical protein
MFGKTWQRPLACFVDRKTRFFSRRVFYFSFKRKERKHLKWVKLFNPGFWLLYQSI